MSPNHLLLIENLKVEIKEHVVLRDVNLRIDKGDVHALMGPNGSGKSTLAYALMGHPAYHVLQGRMIFAGQLLNDLTADKRAQAGLFLAFQYPREIEGVPLKDFLRQSYNALHGGTEKQLGIKAFRALLEEKMQLLGVAPNFVERAINVGFSGGEKKRAEMLQLAVLQPKLAILDEIDSGLDIDALKIVCDGLNSIRKDNPDMALLLITHYPRMLRYVAPNAVHVMQNGIIARSGGEELAEELEREGYSRDEEY